MASPADRGMRFLHVCGERYEWRHHLDRKAYVTDCTEMSDGEFERYVIENSPAPSPQPQGAG